MEIDYKNKKVKTLCSDIRRARAKLGHREATELFSLINLIESAKNLNDVKVFDKYKLHSLKNKNHENRVGQISCTIPPSAFRLILFPISNEDLYWNGEEE